MNTVPAAYAATATNRAPMLCVEASNTFLPLSAEMELPAQEFSPRPHEIGHTYTEKSEKRPLAAFLRYSK